MSRTLLRVVACDSSVLIDKEGAFQFIGGEGDCCLVGVGGFGWTLGSVK